MHKTKEKGSKLRMANIGKYEAYPCPYDGRALTQTAAQTYLISDLNKITYEYGPLPHGYSENNCFHESMKLSHWPIANFISTHVQGWVSEYENWSLQATDLESYCQTILDREADDPTYSALAFDTMRPKLERKMELMVSLIELSELKTLLKSVWRLSTSLKRLISEFKRLASKPSRTIAEVNLFNSFALQPFIGDCKVLWGASELIAQEISRFTHNAGKPLVAHFKRVILDEHGIDNTMPWAQVERKRAYSHKMSVFCKMRYSYTVPSDIMSFKGKIRAARDILGLHFDVTTAWELIPFSFVVDWFTGFSGFLKQFAARGYEPEVNILDFTRTYKVEVWVEDSLRWNSPCNWPIEPQGIFRLSDRLYHKIYKRQRIVPETGTYFTTSKPNFGLKQLGLAASLLRVAKS